MPPMAACGGCPREQDIACRFPPPAELASRAARDKRFSDATSTSHRAARLMTITYVCWYHMVLIQPPNRPLGAYWVLYSASATSNPLLKPPSEGVSWRLIDRLSGRMTAVGPDIKHRTCQVIPCGAQTHGISTVGHNYLTQLLCNGYSRCALPGPLGDPLIAFTALRRPRDRMLSITHVR